MKTFSAKASFRTDDTTSRVMVREAGGVHHLPLHKERGAAYLKSPDGHAWGYAGSGPAQLALDLLWEIYGSQPAPPLFQRFKEAFVAKLDQDAGWSVSEERIREMVEALGGWQPAYDEKEAWPSSATLDASLRSSSGHRPNRKGVPSDE